MNIGERIKNARKLLGITQEELGKKCGVAKQTIFKYENGIITNIPIEKLKMISQVLDISAESLMGWDSPDNEIESLMNLKFASHLKSARISSGTSLLEISDYLTSLGYELSTDTINNWESGISYPNPSMFLEMCVYYGVEDVLLEFGYKESPHEKGEDSNNLKELKHMYDQLNDKGKEALIRQAKFLTTESDCVKKENFRPHGA